MSVATAVQPALFEAETLEVAEAPSHTYTEADRAADRHLCQRYFRGWTGSFGGADAAPAGHHEINFADFEAASDRLAENARS